MANVNDIAAWRERTFTSLLAVVLVVGSLSTVAIFPLLVSQGMWTVAVADTVALVWIFAVWRLKKLSYTARVLHFLTVVYLLSVVLMLTVGAASLSYLLGPPLIASILLGMRPAMLALVLGAASLVALGADGHIVLHVPGWEHDPLKASLVAALNYGTTGAMLVLTSSTLLKGLASSLSDLELTSAAVSRLNDLVLIAKAADAQQAPQPITFANDAFLRRTGYTREEIVGHSLHVLQGPETDPAVLKRLFYTLIAGQPCNAELICYTRAGD
jgi:hypothetical protein